MKDTRYKIRDTRYGNGRIVGAILYLVSAELARRVSCIFCQSGAQYLFIKNAATRRHFYFENELLVLLALLGALALLVRDAAAGLASRLAGSLALAAATLLCALAQVAGLNGLDMLHDGITSVKNTVCIIAQIGHFVNTFAEKT